MLKLPRDRSQCSQRPALCGVFGCGAARLMSVMGRILLKTRSAWFMSHPAEKSTSQNRSGSTIGSQLRVRRPPARS